MTTIYPHIDVEPWMRNEAIRRAALLPKGLKVYGKHSEFHKRAGMLGEIGASLYCNQTSIPIDWRDEIGFDVYVRDLKIEVKSMACRTPPQPGYVQIVSDAQRGHQPVAGYLFTRVRDTGEHLIDLSGCSRIYITGTCSRLMLDVLGEHHDAGDHVGECWLAAPGTTIEIRHLFPATNLKLAQPWEEQEPA